MVMLTIATAVACMLMHHVQYSVADNVPSRCISELRKFQICTRTNLRNIIYNQTLLSTRKRQISQCFSGSGCHMPSLASNPQVAQISGSSVPYPSMQYCMKLAIAGAKQRIEKCMARVVPHFTFSVTGSTKLASGDFGQILYVDWRTFDFRRGTCNGCMPHSGLNHSKFRAHDFR
ncbi:unnamed protein product [Soboliphyme baturini]|uniref:Secreted protein n=1 Tax=Soboliphyme baturini TaxID=241478 RepID=A0A183IBC9_9BILA|nr:unnamed protein product [Soboliphyme baturini]